MRKIVVVLMMCLTLWHGQAQAFVPLAIPAAYLVAGAAVATGTVGVYAAMKSGVASNLSAAGLISRPTKMAYYYMVGSVAQLMEKDVNTNITRSQAIGIINSKPTTYPTLKTALSVKDAFVVDSNNLAVNSNIVNPQSSTGYSKVTSIQVFTGGGYSGTNPLFTSGYVNYLSGFNSGTGTYSTMTRYWCSNVTPLTLPATDQQFQANISNPDNTLKSNYQAEMDKVLQDPDYVPSFSDASTGLPPDMSHALSPSDLAIYNDREQKKELAAQTAIAAVDSRQAAVTAAAASVTGARDAYVASGGNPSTGVGGDPALYQKYLDSLRSQATAQAALDQVKATQAADAVKAQELEDTGDTPSAQQNNYDTNIQLPEKKGILGLLQNILASSPLIAMARSLTVSTTDQVSSITAVIFGRTITFDFSRWAWAMSTAGGAMLTIVHGYAVFIVFRRQ